MGPVGEDPPRRYRRRPTRSVARRVIPALVAALGIGAVACDAGSDAAPTTPRDDTTTSVADEAATTTSTTVADVATTDATADADESTLVDGDGGDATDDTLGAEEDADAALDEAPESDGVSQSVLDVIREDPQFSQLAGLIERSGVAAELAGGSITLFAPTDEAFDLAFATIGPDAFATLTGDPDLTGPLVLHHATGAVYGLDQLAETAELVMLDESTVSVAPAGDGSLLVTSGGQEATVAADGIGIVAADGVVYVADSVLVPDGLLDDEAFEVEPDIVATIEGGRALLDGAVVDEAERSTLVAALAASFDAANIDDQLVIDSALGPISDDVDRLASLLEVASTELAPATLTLTGSELVVSGRFADDESRLVVESAAAEVDAATTLSPRPSADAASAAALDASLDQVVAATPLTFEPNSSILTADSAPVIERLAGLIRELADATIAVEGHTDSAGRPATNRRLSEDRASAVVAALAAAGVAEGRLTAVGFGSTMPVLVDGVEDAAASRRVEFTVAMPPG